MRFRRLSLCGCLVFGALVTGCAAATSTPTTTTTTTTTTIPGLQFSAPDSVSLSAWAVPVHSVDPCPMSPVPTGFVGVSSAAPQGGDGGIDGLFSYMPVNPDGSWSGDATFVNNGHGVYLTPRCYAGTPGDGQYRAIANYQTREVATQ